MYLIDQRWRDENNDAQYRTNTGVEKCQGMRSENKLFPLAYIQTISSHWLANKQMWS